MTYEAVFLNTFLKQYQKLSKPIQNRVRHRIQELVENPYLGLRLRGGLEGFWKDRVGDYRLIYRVEEGDPPSSLHKRTRTRRKGTRTGSSVESS